MIEITNISKMFRKKKALADISFLFTPAVWGLIGANGSGKTTLMRCLTNLYNYHGTITYKSKNIRNNSSYISKLGYLPQKFDLFKELTVREMMEYFAAIKNLNGSEQKKAIEESIEMVNLSDRIDDKAGTLSGGMVRRTGIAQAILNNPEILIVDEPTSGLDPEERMRFKNLISSIRDNRSIIISTHIVEDVEAICNRIAILKEGRIIASGNCDTIRDIAYNKVFEISENKKGLLHGDYYPAKRIERENRIIFRVLTEKEQARVVPVNPTVEDGYLWASKWL